MKFMKSQLKKDTVISKITIFAMKTVLKARRNPQEIYDTLKKRGVMPNMTILDYGAGIGSYAFEAAKIVGKGGTVLAAELAPVMIAEMEREISLKKIANVRTIKVNRYSDITQSDFDFIFLIDVLHMMDHQIDVLNFFLKKLKPQGKLLIELDHMKKTEIEQLLNSVSCQRQKLDSENCWLLSN